MFSTVTLVSCESRDPTSAKSQKASCAQTQSQTQLPHLNQPYRCCFFTYLQRMLVHEKQVFVYSKKWFFFSFFSSQKMVFCLTLSPPSLHLYLICNNPTPQPEEMCQNMTSLSQFKCSLTQHCNKFSTILVLSLSYLQCKGCHHLFASQDFGEVDLKGGLAAEPVDVI